MKLRLAFVLLALSLAFSVLASCGGHTTAGYPGDDAGPYVGSDAGGNPIQDASGPALDAGEPPGVSHHGFTWSNTGPQTNDLYGVWGQSPDDVRFVGAAATILHYDGQAFASFDTPAQIDFRSVWGSAADNVWAVGFPTWTEAGSEIWHWNGSAWSRTQSVADTQLYAVYGSGPSDVWTVGAKGKALHFDGQKWSPVALPTTNDLDGVWASGPDDAWAVGSALPVGYQGVILHWDGASWSNVPLPDNGAGIFAKVWGRGPDDVWLVGQENLDTKGPCCDPNGYIVHWNGNSWDAPFVVKPTSTPLFGIGGGSSLVRVVGSGGAAYAHGGGSGWSSRELPGDYRALWQSSAGDAWAVGLGGVMAHWDGGAWNVITPPPPAWGVEPAKAIWANTPSDAWAASNGAVSLDFQHWNGSTWTKSSISAGDATYAFVNQLWGSAPDDMWAVGSAGDQTVARILHYDGTKWSVAYDRSSTDKSSFDGVWGTSKSNVWFAGDAPNTPKSAILVHWDGHAMQEVSVPGPTDGELVALGGTSKDDVLALGKREPASHDPSLRRRELVRGLHGPGWLHHQHLRRDPRRRLGGRHRGRRAALERQGLVEAGKEAAARHRLPVGKQRKRHLGWRPVRRGPPLRRRNLVAPTSHQRQCRRRDGHSPERRSAAHEDRGDSPSSVSVPAAGAIPHPLFALWPWRPPLGARQALAVRARPVGSARRRGRRCDSFRLPSPRTGPRPPP